jgi:hypothetical protein
MRHKRAIKRLINKLGGFKPYVDEDFKDAKEIDETPESQD